jgi:hypothetical protein
VLEKRKCIICANFKNFSNDPEISEFNEEHVFPATIGGRYVIRSVCKKCNKEVLGDKIDTPFANNKLILLERRQHKLQRGVRGIKNPLKDEPPIIIDGNKFRLTVDENGNPKKVLIPQIPKRGEIKLGEKFDISIDKSEIHNIPHIIEQKAKELGIDPSDIILGNTIETHHPEMKYESSFSNNTILFAFVKIAYEFTVSQIPEYIDDEGAKEFLTVIKSLKFQGSIIQKVNPPADIIDPIYNLFLPHLYVPYPNAHIVFLTYIENIGLVFFAKVFGIPQICIMSADSKFRKGGYILGVNDFKKKKFKLFEAVKIKKYHVGIKTDYGQHQALTKEGIYDLEGKLVLKNIDEINTYPNIPHAIKGNLSNDYSIEHLINDSLQFKTANGGFVPIHSITTIYEIAERK